MLQIVYVVLAFAAGAAIAYLYYKSSQAEALSTALERARMSEEAVAAGRADLSRATEAAERKIDEARAEVIRLNGLYASAQTSNDGLQKKLDEQKAEFEALNQKFTKEFENLANRILDEKGKKFSELNESQMRGILDPLRQRINEFEVKIQETHVHQERERGALKEQLRQLTEMNKQMSQEALNLTNALKGESKTQGNWGEMILEKILEKSGLRKGFEYEIQQTISMEDGKRLQPDVVINLPDNKKLIVDSKVSLVAYEKYHSCDDKEQQERLAREHVLSVRNHVKGLSGKNYQNLYSIGSPDFVLMFIPIEPAFSLAVGNDDSLYSEAFEKNIIIVSTSTLLATLRTIENIWRQERQNKNVMEIARQSGDLYEKFAAVVDDLLKVGVKMNEGKAVYDDAMSKLHTGKGNVLSRFERLKSLGAKVSPNKTINPKLLERTDDLDSGDAPAVPGGTA